MQEQGECDGKLRAVRNQGHAGEEAVVPPRRWSRYVKNKGMREI